MGRKKVDRSDKLLMAFEATIPLKQRLLDEANSKYLSVSALIRQILESHYEDR
jgi:hypothetical protein